MGSGWCVKFLSWKIKDFNVAVTVDLKDRRYTYRGEIGDVNDEFIEVITSDNTSICIAHNSIIAAVPGEQADED